MKILSFLKNKVSQTKIVDMRICRLIYFLLRDALILIAVRSNLKWPKAHEIVFNKMMKKYRRMRAAGVPKERLVKIENKIEGALKKYIADKPNLENISYWVSANVNLGFLYFFNGDFKKNIDVYQNVEKSRKSVLKYHQLDDVGIEFIPRFVVSASLGVYENLNTYVMARILDGRCSKKMILLLPPGTPVTNECYLNYWRKYITVITDLELIQKLLPLEKCLSSPFAFAMTYHDKVLISHVAIGIVQGDWDKAKHPPLLSLSADDFSRGWDCLEICGVPRDAWFVCLHVRENGWQDEETEEEEYRNADIDTYIQAVKSITDAGGWVIRLGDSTMKPLPKMVQVIDYATSDVKSDWMDVFLCAQCRFILGTSSGVFMVSVAFGVPSVVTNFMPTFAAFCLSEKDLFLPGLCWSKQKDQYLSFGELLSPPAGIGFENNTYDRLGVEVVKNTAEQIKEIVEEMLSRFDEDLYYSQEDELLQEKFKKVASEVGKQYGDERVRVNARIGKNFLRQYVGLLPQSAEALSQIE